MNNSSTDLYVPAERSPEPDLVDLLRLVHNISKTLNVGYFVVGAMARDLILHHVFGHKTSRLTRDVDLGIRVNDWNQFHALKTALIQTGQFSTIAKMEHRLLFHQGQMPLDLLPFGEIQTPTATIEWPPKGDIVMNLVGYAEASQAALNIEIVGGLTIAVTSLPSLAILKLVAWNERHSITAKDASDLLVLLKSYASAGNMDRLYEHEVQMLVEYKHDPDLTGAALLGKDAALVCSPAAGKIILRILSTQSMKQRLIDQMTRDSSEIGSMSSFGNPEPYIDAFMHGFTKGLVQIT
jgi:predicted nucleotidyltransferase